VKCGVALNPATNPNAISYVLDKVSQVLIMSVNPGFGGQKFIKSSIGKVRYLAEERSRSGHDYKIAVDGGIGADNIAEVRAAGADIIIAGTSILRSEDPGRALDELKALVK
jgi:ribulose-phosphate 3-epimerase